MISHETLEIFSLLWWQSNIVTLSFILFFLLLSKWFNPENRNNLAIAIGVVLIFRTVGIHFYWNYLGIWTIETSLLLHFFIVYLPFVYLNRQAEANESARGLSV